MSDRLLRCTVCREDAEPRRLQVCYECEARFHMSMRADGSERDCGAPLLSNACGISVACDPCIDRMERETGYVVAVRSQVGPASAERTGVGRSERGEP